MMHHDGFAWWCHWFGDYSGPCYNCAFVFHVFLLSETDVRGTYTLLAVAKLLNILTPELAGDCLGFVRRRVRRNGSFMRRPCAGTI